jgi:hypothetical protein
MDHDGADRPVGALRGAINDSASHVQSVQLTFLAACGYVAVATASTTHGQLLRASGSLRLPIFDIEISLIWFYLVAPVLLFALHLNLFLQLRLLAGKVHAFARTVGNAEIQSATELLYPLLFLRVLLARHGASVDWVAVPIVWLSVIVACPILMAWMTFTFLPYHNAHITLWQAAITAADVAMIWWIWPVLRDPDGSWTSWLRSKARAPWIALAAMLSSVAFIAGLSTIIGRTIVTGYGGLASAVIQLEGETLVAEEPSAAVVAAYAQLYGQEDGGIDIAWRNHAKGLNLQERDLRHARLTNVRLPKAVLQYANLEAADLGESDLANAQLIGANLRKAFLGEADLRDTRLACANLDGATLLSADLRRADLRGSSLRDAVLIDADLRGAKLDGADVSGANLLGATLDRMALRCARHVQTAKIEDHARPSAPEAAAAHCEDWEKRCGYLPN